MAFQLKDFSSIVAAMINHARSATTRATDWQPGSVNRTIIEAPAVEMEELYHQFFIGLREAIPVSVFLSFGFNKLPPAYAHGFVSVTADAPISDDIPVPIDTEFTTEDGRVYRSTEAVTWESGTSSVRIPVAAETSGTAYNVSAGAITTSSLFGDDYTISNSPITNGRDAESDDEREARFAEFVAGLSKATIYACEYAAKQSVVLDESGNIYEYVTRVGLSETPGYVRIYLYSTEGVPSSQLIANAQRTMDGWRDETTRQRYPGVRAGGVRVEILPMSERAVPFAGAVKLLAGYTLNTALTQELSNAYADALANLQSGDTLYMDTLINEYLLSVTGVLQVIPSTNSNILCGVNEVLTPGTFTVTAIS